MTILEELVDELVKCAKEFEVDELQDELRAMDSYSRILARYVQKFDALEILLSADLGDFSLKTGKKLYESIKECYEEIAELNSRYPHHIIEGTFSSHQVIRHANRHIKQGIDCLEPLFRQEEAHQIQNQYIEAANKAKNTSIKSFTIISLYQRKLTEILIERFRAEETAYLSTPPTADEMRIMEAYWRLLGPLKVYFDWVISDSASYYNLTLEKYQLMKRRFGIREKIYRDNIPRVIMNIEASDNPSLPYQLIKNTHQMFEPTLTNLVDIFKKESVVDFVKMREAYMKKKHTIQRGSILIENFEKALADYRLNASHTS